MELDREISRLRWQCRRGMLELDLLLLQVLEQQYPAFREDQRREFVVLLGYPDPILQRWLIGDGEGVAPEMQAMVRTIRAGMAA